MSDDTDAVESLRAVAEALTIWLELEPPPLVDDGYTPEMQAWLERYHAAACQLAATAGNAAPLRAAHGPPWDSSDPRPLPLGLLISAAIELER